MNYRTIDKPSMARCPKCHKLMQEHTDRDRQRVEVCKPCGIVRTAQYPPASAYRKQG